MHWFPKHGKSMDTFRAEVKALLATDAKTEDATQSEAAVETYRIHTVVKGDTLWDIAQKYLGSGTRYTEIVKLNGLTSNVIYSDMKLKIPN